MGVGLDASSASNGEEAVVPVCGVRARAPLSRRTGDRGRWSQPAASRARTGVSPGFLMLFGDAGDGLDGGVVRVYWHVIAARRGRARARADVRA